MSLSLGDASRVLEMEKRIDALEATLTGLAGNVTRLIDEMGLRDQPARRGRPPKNLEERMKNQEHDQIDAE